MFVGGGGDRLAGDNILCAMMMDVCSESRIERSSATKFCFSASGFVICDTGKSCTYVEKLLIPRNV